MARRVSTNEEKGSVIPWSEVEKHNTAADCWIVVREKVYNITSWVPKHPGGIDTLALNGGRDATQLFEAYHPISMKEKLKLYYVGDVEHDPTRPVFPEMSEFYRTLKVKIEDFFHENKISPRCSTEMTLRSIFLIGLLFALHYWSFTTTSTALAVVLAVLVGYVCALICFMPVHEGSHASTSNSPLAWRLFGAVHDFVNGASFYNWCHQHFLGHHPYTNLSDGNTNESIDPDIVTGDPDVRRIKPSQRHFSHYTYQQYYVPLIYGLLAIKFRINDFIILFVSKKNGVVKVNPPDTWHLAMFFLGKIFFVLYRIVLPIYFAGLDRALLIFAISDLVSGWTLAFVFQVNHVIPQAKWPVVDKKTGKVGMDWAEMQVTTTMDYAHGSYWTTVLTGALNYQVAHHLFPYISQLHYPAIAPIIVEHCKKYNLPYHVLPDFGAAFKNHLDYLAQMGTPSYDF